MLTHLRQVESSTTTIKTSLVPIVVFIINKCVQLEPLRLAVYVTNDVYDQNCDGPMDAWVVQCLS